MSPQLVQSLVAVAIIILVSFPVHEFSHAWAAFRLGDSTARYLGRLTLNPIVHFDPLGGSLLALSALVGGIFIGWAKPTPVNPFNLQYGHRGEAIVALSGPLSNLIMGAAVAMPVRVIGADASLYDQIVSSDVGSFVFGVAVNFVLINVFLMIFNLLPIPPLDGWRVLLGLVDTRTAFNLRRYEQYGFIVLLLLILIAPAFIADIGYRVTGFLLGI